MGNIYSRLLDFEAAIAEFAESVRLDPTNFRGHANMGTALINAKRPKEALPCLDAALRVDPKYAFAHFQKAVALGMLGREDESEKSWEKAIEYDPRYMLGGAGRHLRADRQAELSRAGWRDGRPPKGVGKIRMLTGRRKARSEEGRERDLALARLDAACEMEGISIDDAITAMLERESGRGGASAVRVVRKAGGGEKAGRQGPRKGRPRGGRKAGKKKGGAAAT